MRLRPGLALLALLGAGALPPRTAVAEACASSIDDWAAQAGALRPGLACGSYIGTTDGWGGPFSRGEFHYKKPVTLPLRLGVTWRRLGSDGGESLSLILPGGYLLLTQDAYGFYSFSESDFKWLPLPGFRTQRESRIEVVQSAREIALWVDGRLAGRLPFTAPGAGGTVGVAFKGVSGYRSRMMFRDFSARTLDAAQGQSPATAAARPK